MPECNKCHASRVARDITLLCPEAMATIDTEFVKQEVVALLGLGGWVWFQLSAHCGCASNARCGDVYHERSNFVLIWAKAYMSVLPSFSNFQGLPRAAFKTCWFESFYYRSVSRWKGFAPADLPFRSTKTCLSGELAGLGASLLH